MRTKRSRKEKFAIWLSDRYLRLAETSPFSKIPSFRLLQEHREHDRKRAKESLEDRRPPKGCSFDFLSFTLIEAFTQEEFGRLKQGLIKVFPSLVDPLHFDDFRARIGHQSETLHAGSWQNVGFIYRRENLIGPSIKRHLPELPNEVDYIHVESQHLLPSLIVVSFTVYLNELATERLKAVQAEEHLPQYRFASLAPWRLNRGHITYPAQRTQHEKLTQAFESMRAGVEVQLRPYVSGHFSRLNENDVCRLPSIELVAIKGAPKTGEAFSKWLATARPWLDSLTINRGFLHFRNKTQWFQPPERFSYENDDRSEGKLMVHWEKYRAEMKRTPMNDLNREGMVRRLSRSELESLITRVALKSLLESTQRSIERIRVKSVLRTTRSRRLGTQLRFYGEVLRASRLLERFSMEFAHGKGEVEYRLQSLSDFDLYFGDDKRKHTLDAVTMEEVERLIHFLGENIQFYRTSFSDLVNLQNLRNNYRLQVLILVLTVVATLAAILSVIAGWESLRRVFYGSEARDNSVSSSKHQQTPFTVIQGIRES